MYIQHIYAHMLYTYVHMHINKYTNVHKMTSYAYAYIYTTYTYMISRVLMISYVCMHAYEKWYDRFDMFKRLAKFLIYLL